MKLVSKKLFEYVVGVPFSQLVRPVSWIPQWSVYINASEQWELATCSMKIQCSYSREWATHFSLQSFGSHASQQIALPYTCHTSRPKASFISMWHWPFTECSSLIISDKYSMKFYPAVYRLVVLMERLFLSIFWQQILTALKSFRAMWPCDTMAKVSWGILIEPCTCMSWSALFSGLLNLN